MQTQPVSARPLLPSGSWDGEQAGKPISYLPPVLKCFFFLLFSFLLLITYPKGGELNLYNSRDFTFAAHQPNPLTAHREEQ